MPYPTEWPEQWAIRSPSHRFDPNDPLTDGNADIEEHLRRAHENQIQERQGRIMFDDITLRRGDLQYARLQREREPRTINWIQLYRAQRFVPPLDLVRNETRRRFIEALTEAERIALSTTEWEPILRDQWRPTESVNTASVLWTIYGPLPGDSTGSIPWFDTYIYHFRIVPRRHHSLRVLYFLYRRQRLVYGSRQEIPPVGPEYTWRSSYHTHGVRETHFVISIGSTRVSSVTSIRIDADETYQVQSAIQKELVLFRPSRMLYKSVLNQLDSIGYPSPPLRQLYELKEVEQYLELYHTTSFPLYHQLVERQETGGFIQTTIPFGLPTSPRTLERIRAPRPPNPLHVTFQQLDEFDESPHPFF
jgi:hypothetical protein